jgi:hypothetical protein
MQLGSSALSSGLAIPRRFTCDGEDISPPLDWQAAPDAGVANWPAYRLAVSPGSLLASLHVQSSSSPKGMICGLAAG